MENASLGLLFVGASAAAAFWALLGAVYRLYFHPLWSVPGPRLAALTFWYEVYYDLIKSAQFPWQIVKLHEKYGPIVRISPNEVHISDVSYASTHFSNSIPLNRHISYRDMFGMPAATFSTIEYDLHKLRSGALRNMFSKKRIFQLEPLITKKVDACIARLNAFKSSGDVVDLRLLFTCLTTDIITEYNLARSYDLLSTPDLSPAWRTTFESALRNYHLFKHFPVLWPVVRAVPYRIITFLSPDFNLILNFERDNQNQARAAIDRSSEEKDYEHTSVFRELLSSDLPPTEKIHARLWQEAQSLVGAGTETTANTLGFIIFSLLSAPEKMARLTDELHELTDRHNPASLQQLEQLPYLTAVIQEGLRLAMGVVARIIRVSPSQALSYKAYKFPAGTAVSMDIMTLHHDPHVFPDPEVFEPERWMDGKLSREALFTFSKGPRMCVGFNLAYAELYLTLERILTDFKLELYETSYKDVEAVYDGFVPMHRVDSKGVRVRVMDCE